MHEHTPRTSSLQIQAAASEEKAVGVGGHGMLKARHCRTVLTLT